LSLLVHGAAALRLDAAVAAARWPGCSSRGVRPSAWPRPPPYARRMGSLPSLSLGEWVVLAVISERPTHGFAIAQLTAADGDLGRMWQIPRPVVYRALGRIEAADLIANGGTEPGNGPQRTIYAATSTGRRAVAAWLQTPVEHVRDVRSHLLLKLALLHRAGADPADLLRRQQAILAPIARAMITVHEEPEGFEATLLAWRRANAAAALSFLADITPTS
jgi:DNA-binding PadR family transcriptional regulator